MPTKLFLYSAMILFLSNILVLNAAESEQANKPDRAEGDIKQASLGMNVSGNKELPNVLYIIPWKKDAGQVKPPVAARMVKEIYQPLDPDVFAKQVDFYYEQVSSGDK